MMTKKMYTRRVTLTFGYINESNDEYSNNNNKKQNNNVCNINLGMIWITHDHGHM